MRYSIVQYICRHGVLPRGDDPEIRNEIWGFSYGYTPILPYIIGGYAARFVSRWTDDISVFIFTARMVSVIAGAVTTVFMSLIGGELFKGAMRYALPFLTAFFPSFLFVTCYVSTEAFAVMSTAVIVWYWMQGMKNGWRIRDCIGLCVGMALCLLTYYNAYGFILASIPLFFVTIAKRGKSRKEIVWTTVFVIMLTFALAGWWFIRNGILYDGDIFGRHAMAAQQELYVSDEVRTMLASTPQKSGISLRGMLFDMKWIVRTGKSFFGAMSALGILSTEYLAIPYALLFGILVLGNLILIVRFFIDHKRENRKQRAVFYIANCFCAAFPTAVAVWYSYTSDFEPQGRYLLPGLVSILVLGTMGAQAFVPDSGKRGESNLPGTILLGSGLLLNMIFIIMVLYVYMF